MLNPNINMLFFRFFFDAIMQGFLEHLLILGRSESYMFMYQAGFDLIISILIILFTC